MSGGVMGQVWLNKSIAVEQSLWIDGTAFATPSSLCFRGLQAGDALELHVANDLAQPQQTDDGIIYGAPVQNNDQYITILVPFRWYKVKHTTIPGSPNPVTVTLAAWRPPLAHY